MSKGKNRCNPFRGCRIPPKATKWKPTVNEKAIMNETIMQELVKVDNRKATLCDSLIIMTYLELIGTQSKYRAREFWDTYERLEDELQHYYETLPAIIKDGELELNFYALEELKKIGVDLELWRAKGTSWNPVEDEIWNKVSVSGRKPKGWSRYLEENTEGDLQI